MDDFLTNDINKQTIIHLIADCLREKGCNVINSAGDADVDIVKAAVTMAYDKSTIVIGEDTDLLCLLLFHSSNGCMDLYFRPDKDKGNPNVYNIKVFKLALGGYLCSDLLFIHAFIGVTQPPESLVLANSLYFKNSPTITLSCAIVLRSSVLQMSTKLLLKRLVARLWYACSMGDHCVTSFFAKKWQLQVHL